MLILIYEIRERKKTKMEKIKRHHVATEIACNEIQRSEF